MRYAKQLDPQRLAELYEYDNGVLRYKQGKLKGRIAGTKDPHGDKIRSLELGQLRVHNVVWTLMNGPIPRKMLVKHRNGNRSDNRIENLYLVEGVVEPEKLFKAQGVPMRREETLSKDWRLMKLISRPWTRQEVERICT